MRDSTLIADRYQLVDLIGAGAMGEVWRARDLKFEQHVVAVKLLKDDQTRREDADGRERLLRAIGREGGSVTVGLGSSLLAEALRAGSGEEAVRIRVRAAVDPSGRLVEAVLANLFDTLIDDPAYSETARLRARLRRLFRDEANSVANLRHENIVRISDYGDDRGTPYLAMDYIDGETLLRLIQRGEPMERAFQLRLMEDLCNGLAYAHRRKLVHRDIKPANLIVEAGTFSLKVLDFGVVRRLQDSSESTMGLPIGTLCYMSPEQIAGSRLVDHRSDVFAVGLVFYELLSGQKAFPPGRGITDLMSRIQHAPPPSLDELVTKLEPGIDEILGRAIEKEPDRRYQDLADMQQELSQVRARLTTGVESREGTGESTIVVRHKDEPLIPRLLRLGEQALDVGEPSVALDRAQEVLSLDPSNALAIGLQERARVALEDRRIQSELARVGTLMKDGHLSEAREAWTAVRDRRPAAEDVRAVGRRLDQAETEEAERRDREARLALAVERARQRLDAEDFERTLDAAREALAIDPGQAEAKRLADAAQSRIDERRLARQREDERQRQLTALLGTFDKALAARRFDDALATIAAATALAPERADLAARRSAAERARDEQRVTDLLARVDAFARQGDLDRAVAMLATDHTLSPRLAVRLRELEERSEALKQQKERPRPLPEPPAPPKLQLPGPSRRRIWWMSGGTVVAIAIAVATVIHVRHPGTVVPLPPPPDLSTVTVDFRPWARVRIVGLGGAAVSGDTRTTPFVIRLPPGRYRAEGENGDLTKPAQQEFEVVQGQPANVEVDMPGFEPDRLVDRLLTGAK